MSIFLSAVVLSCIKVLFLHSYHSTDFEVHRNWLAISHSLPLHKWYYEDTSEWTLDYPPFFAYFEYFLSQFASFFDPAMLTIGHLNYASAGTVFFQKLTVIFTDLVFAYGTLRCCKALQHYCYMESFSVLGVLLLTNAGLFIVDHIHFQYNGFLYGILLLSVANIIEGKNLQGAMWFAILLNFKHIYLYVAPAYFIYLLRSYCFTKRDISWSSLSMVNLFKLGIIVLGVFAASFGPFIYLGQVQQVLSRLFPFKRGLCHAYWAPNVWVFYNIADKAATFAGHKLGYNFTSAVGSMTGGLVQESEHTILPSIPPLVTFLCTFIAMIPSLIKVWSTPNDIKQFIRALVGCGYASFLFGWHVHEKAVLLIIIPMTLLAVCSKNEASIYFLTSVTGHLSLFPLLYLPFETPLKVLLCLIHASLSFSLLKDFHKPHRLVTYPEMVYLSVLSVVFLYEAIIHRLINLDQKLPFLPLLLYSVFCAIGITYSWIRFHFVLFGNKNKPISRSKKIR